MPRANSNPRIYIGWAENRYFGCILYPPVRAQNTEITEKKKKIGAKNVSRETFSALNCDTCPNHRTIKKRWLGVSPTHLFGLMLHKSLHYQPLNNIWTGIQQFTDSLQAKPWCKANSVTKRYPVAAMPQNGTTGLRPAGRTLQPIYRTEYKRNRALSTLLWVENFRYLCPNSDLRPTRKAWGVDIDDSCPSCGKRQRRTSR